MPEISATDAARGFADVLDAVEHRGTRYTIVRRGRPVAHIVPIAPGRGADVKALLRRHHPDVEWADQLSELRDLLDVEPRP